MKHQVLQVLILVISTKADADGQDGSSSLIYPGTFFREPLQTASIESGNQHQGFGTFNRIRSGKSLNLDADPAVTPIAIESHENVAKDEASIVQLPRKAKAESRDEIFSQLRKTFFSHPEPDQSRAGRLGFENAPVPSSHFGEFLTIDSEPTANTQPIAEAEQLQRNGKSQPLRNTFFGNPLNNQESSATFGSGENVNSERTGKTASFAPSQQTKGQVDAILPPRVQSSQGQPEFRQSQNEVRNLQQIHEDVQRKIKEAPQTQQTRIIVPIPQVQNTRIVPPAAHTQFQFRNSRNEVVNFQQLQEEIEALKRANQNTPVIQDEQTQIQLQGQQRQPQIVHEQRLIPVPRQEEQITRSQPNIIQEQIIRSQPNIIEEQIILSQPNIIQEQIIPSNPNVIHGNQQNLQNFPQTSFGSSSQTQLRPVQNAFVHHEVQNQRRFQQVQRPQQPTPAEVSLRGLRSGKSDSLETFSGNNGHQSTLFGASSSDGQFGSNLGSFGNHKTGNFVGSSRIGKSNAFETGISQKGRQVHRHTFFGALGNGRLLTGTQSSQPELSQDAGLDREGKAETQEIAVPVGQPGTFFGATQKVASSLGTSQGRKKGNFVSSGSIGKANSLSSPRIQPIGVDIVHAQNVGSSIGSSQGRRRGNFVSSGSIGKVNSLSSTRGQVPAQNTGTQVQGIQNSPIEIHTLPNIRPEVREVLDQNQNFQPPRTQFFGRDSQNVRPIPGTRTSSQIFGTSSNVQRFPQTSQINPVPVEEISAPAQVFGRVSQHTRRLPLTDQINSGVAKENIRPVQSTFQPIQRFPQPIEIKHALSAQRLRQTLDFPPAFSEQQALQTNEV